MSRTIRTLKNSSDKTSRDNRQYSCKCERCVGGKTRYHKIGEDLLSDGLKESSFEDNK